MGGDVAAAPIVDGHDLLHGALGPITSDLRELGHPHVLDERLLRFSRRLPRVLDQVIDLAPQGSNRVDRGCVPLLTMPTRSPSLWT